MTVHRQLELQQGSAADFEVFLFDPNGDAEDLSGATSAEFVMQEILGDDTTTKLTRSTTAGNLSIDSAAGKLGGTLTQLEADALAKGTYSGQASVVIGGKNLVTLEFRVVVRTTGVSTS